MIAEKRSERRALRGEEEMSEGFLNERLKLHERRTARDVSLPLGTGDRTLQTSFVRVRIFKVAAEWVTRGHRPDCIGDRRWE